MPEINFAHRIFSYFLIDVDAYMVLYAFSTYDNSPRYVENMVLVFTEEECNTPENYENHNALQCRECNNAFETSCLYDAIDLKILVLSLLLQIIPEAFTVK